MRTCSFVSDAGAAAVDAGAAVAEATAAVDAGAAAVAEATAAVDAGAVAAAVLSLVPGQDTILITNAPKRMCNKFLENIPQCQPAL